jgi:hypothetical protein
MDFLTLDAQDGAQGQSAFEYYGLRGHPSFIFTLPGGEVIQRIEGIPSAQDLEQAILDVLDEP